MNTVSPTIDHLLGEIASLLLEDQALLYEVIGHRLVKACRREIADQAAEARAVVERGEVRRGMNRRRNGRVSPGPSIWQYPAIA